MFQIFLKTQVEDAVLEKNTYFVVLLCAFSTLGYIVDSDAGVTLLSSVQAQGDNRKQVPTLSGQFRQSLDSLMKTLSACHPFFIRCFKPNNDKRSEVNDTRASAAL